MYDDFWIELIHNYSMINEIPSIITFNYDLVLERSLFQVLNNIYYTSGGSRLPFDKISIKYYYKYLSEKNYNIKYIQYRKNVADYFGASKLEETVDNNNAVEIEILKLHGSVNFPNGKKELGSVNIAESADKPFIMPPIFNKMQNNQADEIWKAALERLRNAKNIIIVGYSMPQTDIYMKYFLKSALGPNINLNMIYVFNPVFAYENNESIDMKSRYESCFSPQLHDRIMYNPTFSQFKNDGTFRNFIMSIDKNKYGLLF